MTSGFAQAGQIQAWCQRRPLRMDQRALRGFGTGCSPQRGARFPVALSISAATFGFERLTIVGLFQLNADALPSTLPTRRIGATLRTAR